jgi:hypothetical protein
MKLTHLHTVISVKNDNYTSLPPRYGDSIVMFFLLHTYSVFLPKVKFYILHLSIHEPTV